MLAPTRLRRSSIGPVLAGAACALLAAWPADAQRTLPCGAAPHGALVGATGRRITDITVQTAPPDRLLGVLPAPLHVTTRESVVRSQLLIAVGDTVDTLRVAESVRQIRKLRFLAGAAVTAACDDSGGVAVSIVTRDAWSMRPRFAYRGTAQAALGIEETNLLGTGRAGRLYVRSDGGPLAFGVAYSDPTLLGGRLVGTASHDAYSHGSAWSGVLHSADAGVFAPWGFGVALRQTTRESVGQTAMSALGDTVRRSTAALLVSRRLTLSPAGATYLQFGAEAERTTLVAGADLPLVGPAAVRRRFVGIDVGGARRSGLFVGVPWLLPSTPDSTRRALTRAEVPLGFEADGIVGLGRDHATGRASTHVDAWSGRVWPLGWQSAARAGERVPSALLSADIWAQGYRARGTSEWSGGKLLGSVGFVAPARRGLWSARISGEQLAGPDPDVRDLALSDPAFRAIPTHSRLAEAAMSASLERTVHLRPVSHSYVLGAALFAVGSARWDAASVVPGVDLGARARNGETVPGGPPLYVGSLGTGLRLTPTRFGRAGLRLDVGWPVVRSASVPKRPYVGISISPAFGIGRQRDGRTALSSP